MLSSREMGSRTVLSLFCEVKILKIIELGVGGSSMMENSLRMLANYLQGCMEIILNWRDILGVSVN